VEQWLDHTPILIDDIISTGQTMIETVSHLKKARLRAPVCIGVHAVFAGTSYEDLKKAGAHSIITCSTIPHVSNAIDISETLSGPVKRLAASERLHLAE
jgi:ribose-phosphate pyrophosphokinase